MLSYKLCKPTFIISVSAAERFNPMYVYFISKLVDNGQSESKNKVAIQRGSKSF